MLMRMLEAGGMDILTDNLRQADEDNPNGYYEFERVKKLPEDTDWLPEARGRAVKIIYQLLTQLPADYEYRVLFMCRNLDEVIASQERMLQRRGKPGNDLDRAELARLFHRQLTRLHAWLREQPNCSLLFLQYDAILHDPHSIVEEIERFLGRSLDKAAMARTVDPALYRQRADPYARK